MSTANDLSDALAAAVQSAQSSLVRVEARAHRGATGTVWSADGVVITAHHAVEREENVYVTLPDGKTSEATLLGRDPGTDVAVLRIEAAQASGLVRPNYAPLAGHKVGQLALTLARPGRTVRAALGILGAMGGEFRTPAGGKLEQYVQTDTAPQIGFSGGLVVDVDGRALGMNTSGILRETNVVVPTATLERVVGEIVSHGQVRRGYIGVGVYPVRLTAALEQQFGQHFGLVVVAIEPGSPADKGGLLLGDVLISVDGQGIGRPGDLAAALEDRVGKAIPLKVHRAGSVRDVAVTPAHRS